MEMHSPTMGKLFEALSKAQGEIENASKDKKNPFYKSTYADLASIWDVCKSATSKHGLSVMQTIEGTKAEMFVITWLGHLSGEWMKSKIPLVTDRYDKEKKLLPLDCQSMGSAITYARRFGLASILNICTVEDDDGEKAVNHSNESHDSSKYKVKASSMSLTNTEPVKSLGYDEFTSKHLINRAGSTMNLFMEHLCKTSKKSQIELVNAAIKNESGFIEQYEKWLASTYAESQKEEMIG